MTKPTKVVTAIAAATIALLAFIIGLPLLAMAAMIGSGDPLVPTDDLHADDLPPLAAVAYQRAAGAARQFDPPCEVPAAILAGIGEIESGHGTHGGATIAPNGDVQPPIIGVPLPHLGPDTDEGVWDGSDTVDHAVGPMQFIPTTWRAYALDGNDDGIADPHNIHDAALTAAAYLCASAPPMADEDDWRRGLHAYNQSHAYVNDVLEAAERYRRDAPSEADSIAEAGAVQLLDVPGIGPTNTSWAPQVQALLDAAAADGLTLTGHSYRDPTQQIALRRQNCGTSHHATYQMPADQCSPPTARPGTSNHELGLAIDFHNCSTRATTCYQWLIANAHRHGIYNLPSEPWHWSIDGR